MHGILKEEGGAQLVAALNGSVPPPTDTSTTRRKFRSDTSERRRSPERSTQTASPADVMILLFELLKLRYFTPSIVMIASRVVSCFTDTHRDLFESAMLSRTVHPSVRQLAVRIDGLLPYSRQEYRDKAIDNILDCVDRIGEGSSVWKGLYYHFRSLVGFSTTEDEFATVSHLLADIEKAAGQLSKSDQDEFEATFLHQVPTIIEGGRNRAKVEGTL